MHLRKSLIPTLLLTMCIAGLPLRASATEDAFFGGLSYGKNVGLRFDYCGAVDFSNNINDFMYAINFLDGVVARMKEEGTLEPSRAVVIRPYQTGCFDQADFLRRSTKSCTVPDGGGEPSGGPFPRLSLPPCYELSMTMQGRQKTIDAAIAMLLSVPGSTLGSSERTVDIPALQKKFAAKIEELEKVTSVEPLGRSPDGTKALRMEFKRDTYTLILTQQNSQEKVFSYKATELIPQPVWSASSRYLAITSQKNILIVDTLEGTQTEHAFTKFQKNAGNAATSYRLPSVSFHPTRDILLLRFSRNGWDWSYVLFDPPSSRIIMRKEVKGWLQNPWQFAEFFCADQKVRTTTSCPTMTFTTYYANRVTGSNWIYPPCTYTVMKTPSIADTTLRALFKGPHYGPNTCEGNAPGFGNLEDAYLGITVYPTYKENGKTLKNVAVVRFTKKAKSYFVCGTTDSHDPLENGVAIEKTLLQFKTISAVRLSIDGLIVLPGCKPFPQTNSIFKTPLSPR